uniref:Taste receptor type 2 n=1 Tax=Leptobrachium leishanense TaxID=445787 RepID=A0A8C5M369_9ANUR
MPTYHLLIMLPIFLLSSMAILGATTLMGIVSNCIIITVNVVGKEKGKFFSSSDLILVTLGISNIIFQFGIFSTFKCLLYFPIFSSFWFTVCLCVYYCLQIVLFTHPFLRRLKLGISKIVPWFLTISVITSTVISVPALWSSYTDVLNVNVSSNESLEDNVLKLNMPYLLSSNIIGCSIPLLLVAISNGLILRSLASPNNKTDRASNVQKSHAEARDRAARTVGSLLLLYIEPTLSPISVILLDVLLKAVLPFKNTHQFWVYWFQEALPDVNPASQKRVLRRPIMKNH